MNSSYDDHAKTHGDADDRLGVTAAQGHDADDDSFDVLQGEDDINKYRKLVEAFRLKFGENNAFADTFIDQDMYEKTMNSEDYLRVCVDMFKYINHTSFNKKPVVTDKNKKSGQRF